jgi:hypothetical protein
MPAPNSPFEGIPDLTLPERSDPPPPPPSPFQPMAMPPKETPLPVSADAWKVGDNVLAPWEPEFLYAGVIQQIEQGQAHIAFGDGDEGWVFLSQLRPVDLRPGQKVLCRRKPGRLHVPAHLRAVSGERIQVEFTDGVDWMTTASLRIPTEADGPGAVVTRAESHQAFFRDLRPGVRVWAAWTSTALFAGTVTELNDRQEAHIQFDDGDAGWVKIAQLLPLDLFVGMYVFARRKMGSQYFPGTITQLDNPKICIVYEDGGSEWTTPAALVLSTSPTGANARPTKNAVSGGGGRGSIGWIIVGGIILLRLIAFLMR